MAGWDTGSGAGEAPCVARAERGDAAADTRRPPPESVAHLLDAPITSLDRAIIRDGIAAGLVTSHCTGDQDDIAWLRFRAACARAERALTPDERLRSYLRARETQADAEATARELARERIDARARRAAARAGYRIVYFGVTDRFAERFRELVISRLGNKRGIYAECAKQLGVPQSSIYRWLNARRLPQIEQLITIAERFGTTLDYLLLGIGPERSPHRRRAR